MLKKSLCLLAVSLLFVSCGDSDDSNDACGLCPDGACVNGKCVPTPDVCAKNTCKDASTLYVCANGVRTEQACGAGKECRSDACVDTGAPSACTENTCKDASTLYVCANGVRSEQACGAGKECRSDACVDTGAPSACTENTCKDLSTLYVCTNGVQTEQACGAGKECQDGGCVDRTQPSGNRCVQDTCKDALRRYQCANGKKELAVCNDNEICRDGACTDVSSMQGQACEVSRCSASDPQTVMLCSNGVYSETPCSTGQVCAGGACVEAYSLNSPCPDADGFGKCNADKTHAIVCKGGKIKRYTCAEDCEDTADGIVNCPKKETQETYDECDPKTFQAECIENGERAKLCVKRQIVYWTCYGMLCNVAENTVYCPKNAGVAGLGGLESGGSYGDMCNIQKYQEACIDNYYARVCDADAVVRLHPAKDCRISETNPLKVEYDEAGVPCDTSLDIDQTPFCINDGKAVGFCGYLKGSADEGIYKAAECLGCTDVERAKACMLE